MNLVAYDTNFARKLWISHLMLNALQDMNTITSLGGQRDGSTPQYRFYSAHDDQIANVMVQIAPKYLLDRIDFAGSIFFELYKNGNNFNVKVIYDGQTLHFDECDNQDLCSYEDFTTLMQNRLITDGPSLREACNASPTPE